MNPFSFAELNGFIFLKIRSATSRNLFTLKVTLASRVSAITINLHSPLRPFATGAAITCTVRDRTTTGRVVTSLSLVFVSHLDLPSSLINYKSNRFLAIVFKISPTYNSQN